LWVDEAHCHNSARHRHNEDPEDEPSITAKRANRPFQRPLWHCWRGERGLRPALDGRRLGRVDKLQWRNVLGHLDHWGAEVVRERLDSRKELHSGWISQRYSDLVMRIDAIGMTTLANTVVHGNCLFAPTFISSPARMCS
jgi:hypothetical protein